MNSQHLNEKKSHLGVDYFEKMHIIKNRKEDEVAIMLIQFNFKNFRSFREEATLDLSATKMTEFSERVVTIGREKILPVAAIYGANASGKSNIYSAFEYMACLLYTSQHQIPWKNFMKDRKLPSIKNWH